MQFHILHVLYAINLMAAFLALLFQKYTDVKEDLWLWIYAKLFAGYKRHVGQFWIKNTGTCEDIKITR